MSTRLALVTPDFPPAVGGIQRVVAELSARLSPRFDVVVVTPRQRQAGAFDAAASYEIVRTKASWGGVGSAAVLAETAARLRALRAEVVVVGHVALLPALSRADHVAGLLYGSELWNPAIARLLRRGAWQRVHRFAAISAFTRTQAVASGIAPDRVAVAPLGADAPLPPWDADEIVRRHGLATADGSIAPYLLSVSRLEEPHKGQDAVIRALPPVLARVPAARYVIAGDGRLRAYLERVADAAGVRDRVVFTGRVADAERDALLSRCRALTMISREAHAAAQFEGFGLVYVEAARAGRPSIAGRAGGAPEVVEDGVGGLVVAPDDPVEIAAACIRLLEDEAVADELGRRARARAEAHFTWESAGARLVDGLGLGSQR